MVVGEDLPYEIIGKQALLQIDAHSRDSMYATVANYLLPSVLAGVDHR